MCKKHILTPRNDDLPPFLVYVSAQKNSKSKRHLAEICGHIAILASKGGETQIVLRLFSDCRQRLRFDG